MGKEKSLESSFDTTRTAWKTWRQTILVLLRDTHTETKTGGRNLSKYAVEMTMIFIAHTHTKFHKDQFRHQNANARDTDTFAFYFFETRKAG
jgi:hypothetical protein